MSGTIAKLSRPRTDAVAGYDLTFSPVKSVSTLWAVADQRTSAIVESAHHAAVADALRFIEDRALYTRTGAQGVRQVDVRGLVAAAFVHRDSRAGDPDLHTHVAVANKVQTLDGRWLSIDGRLLFKATVAAAECYNTALEAHLTHRLGVRFAERPNPDPRKRPIREIVGVDPRLNQRWSTRRAAIEARTGELATQFQADHGRPPTPVETVQLAQRATLETRDAKHEPRSLAEQRATWRQQASEVLGGDQAIAAMVTGTLHPTRKPVPECSEEWVRAAAGRVLEAMETRRSTWQVWHVHAEALRQIRPLALAPDQVEQVANRVTAEVLGHGSTSLARPSDGVVEPDVLRRRDGTSVYTVAGSDLYTSSAVLAAERRLVDVAGRTDGRTIPDTSVDVALLEMTANGVDLDPGQAALVRAMATSGAPVAAGDRPGRHRQNHRHARARPRLDQHRRQGRRPRPLRRRGRPVAGPDRSTHRHPRQTPLVHHPQRPARLGAEHRARQPGDHRRGRNGRHHLPRHRRRLRRRPRRDRVRLVGDDQQLAAIGAGGVLRDIATTHGAVRLTELHRFTNPAEAAATLALREGRSEALGFYLDQRRIHVGDPTTSADQLYAAWKADRNAGLDALMLAPTRELAAQLNQRARTEHVGRRSAAAAVDLADGNQASPGDVVITRRNDRRLRTSPTDWVKNGDRWTVHAVHRDGGLTVQHLHHGRLVRLPADYVTGQVELGYATTVHAAQGVTADTMHGLVTGDEARQQLYTMATRGRTANHLYLQVVGDGDPHSVIRPEHIHPATAVDILEQILARDDAARSATTEHRELHDPAVRLGDAAARYHDALHTAAQTTAPPELVERIDAAADQISAGLTGEPAWPTLRGHLLLLHADGHDPIQQLQRRGRGAGDRLRARPGGGPRLSPPRTPRGAGRCPGCPPSPAPRRPRLGPVPARPRRPDQQPHRPGPGRDTGHADLVPPGARPDRQLVEQVAVWRAATRSTPPTGDPPDPPNSAGPPPPYQHTSTRPSPAAHPRRAGMGTGHPRLPGLGGARSVPARPRRTARRDQPHRHQRPPPVGTPRPRPGRCRTNTAPPRSGGGSAAPPTRRHRRPRPAHHDRLGRPARPAGRRRPGRRAGGTAPPGPPWSPSSTTTCTAATPSTNSSPQPGTGRGRGDECQQLVWRLSLLLDPVPEHPKTANPSTNRHPPTCTSAYPSGRTKPTPPPHPPPR